MSSTNRETDTDKVKQHTVDEIYGEMRARTDVSGSPTEDYLEVAIYRQCGDGWELFLSNESTVCWGLPRVQRSQQHDVRQWVQALTQARCVAVTQVPSTRGLLYAVDVTAVDAVSPPGVWVPATIARSEWQLGQRRLSATAACCVCMLAQCASWDRYVAPVSWEIVAGIRVCALRTPTLPPATHTNCYIVGSAELIVIDPGSPYADQHDVVVAAIESLVAHGARMAEVWLTHHHGDHVGGAQRLAEQYGVAIAAHEHTAHLLAGRVDVTRFISDGDCQVLSGDTPRTLRALHTPGHAPGHLCFIETATGAAIVGDMLASVGTILIDPSDGDMAQYIASLHRLNQQEARFLLPAHGDAITAPSARIERYVHHRQWREQRVWAALGNSPRCAAELVKLAYADVSPAIYSLAQRSMLSHLYKLAAEGRAEQGPDGWVRKV